MISEPDVLSLMTFAKLTSTILPPSLSGSVLWITQEELESEAKQK